MELTLSSEALRSVPLPELRRGARRRDLSGVELVVGGDEDDRDGTWIDSSFPDPLENEGEMPPIRSLLLREDASLTEILYWSRQAHLIGSELILQSPTVESPLCVPLALLHSMELEDARRAVTWAQMHEAHTGLEVDLGSVDERDVEDVLDVTAPTLTHVRLRGAGPEAPSGTGEAVGTGTLFKELALRGYNGTVALAPSRQGREAVWQEWVFDERGWGCNTAAKKKAAR